jgi:hypothetical protein
MKNKRGKQGVRAPGFGVQGRKGCRRERGRGKREETTDEGDGHRWRPAAGRKGMNVEHRTFNIEQGKVGQNKQNDQNISGRKEGLKGKRRDATK